MGRKALHPSSPAASSSTTAGTSEEEGLHARPLPRILEVAFNVVSGDLGGGRIALRPSSSQCRCVPRRERDRPSSSQRRCLPRRRRDRPSSSHFRYVLRPEHVVHHERVRELGMNQFTNCEKDRGGDPIGASGMHSASSHRVAEDKSEHRRNSNITGTGDHPGDS